MSSDDLKCRLFNCFIEYRQLVPTLIIMLVLANNVKQPSDKWLLRMFVLLSN